MPATYSQMVQGNNHTHTHRYRNRNTERNNLGVSEEFFVLFSHLIYNSEIMSNTEYFFKSSMISSVIIPI